MPELREALFRESEWERNLFKQPVVFVIGAGASREYNFPLGSDLRRQSQRRFGFASNLEPITLWEATPISSITFAVT